MPRKPKPPPAGYDMLIEGLSECIQPVNGVSTFTDDFSGKEVPMAPEIVAARIKHAKIIEDYDLRKKAVQVQFELDCIAAAERRRKLAEDVINKCMKPQSAPKPFKRRL